MRTALAATMAVLLLVACSGRIYAPRPTVSSHPSPVTISHGPYTKEDAQRYADGIARTEAYILSQRTRELAERIDDTGQTILEWQHQMFTHTTGCSVISGSGYVGAGGFRQNGRLVSTFMRHLGVLPDGVAASVAHAPMKKGLDVKPNFGRRPALAVFVIVIVHCPTTITYA